MDFSVSEEQRMLRDTLTSLMARHAPAERLSAWDEARSYPEDLYRHWAEAGLIQLAFPEEYGGLGGSPADVAMVVEEISKHSADLCMPYSSAVFCGLNILRNGNEAQKRHWLPLILSAQKKMLIAMSEPGAGSDATAMSTFAHRDGDHYVINGQKLWVTGAGLKDAVLSVYLKTDRTVSHKEGVSLLLVDASTPGVELRKLDMLGRRCSGTYEIFFKDVRVSAEALIGGEGHGWQCLMSGLQYERAVSAASSCGGAQGVVDIVTAYVKDREQFGRPIGTFQALAHRIADMQTRVDAARMLTQKAVWLSTQGDVALREISEAKLFASETYVAVANEAVQLMGAYGLSREYAIERHFRDARSATIAAGTSEMLRNLIAGVMSLRPR